MSHTIIGEIIMAKLSIISYYSPNLNPRCIISTRQVSIYHIDTWSITMFPLSFLVEVIFTVPLPMYFHATVETRSLVIAVLPCRSCFHMLLPFAPLGGKSYLPLFVGTTNQEDMRFFPSEGSPGQL